MREAADVEDSSASISRREPALPDARTVPRKRTCYSNRVAGTSADLNTRRSSLVSTPDRLRA